MSRPHEDLEHHTLTDHRAGGPAIALASASWWAIEVAHVAAGRAAAAVAAYETLIEKARTSAAAGREAVVLRSHDHRRVIVLLRLDGHEAFRHLRAAWDDHHLLAQRHAVAESRSLALYRLAVSGDPTIDPASSDALAFEHIRSGAEPAAGISAPLAAAPGFRSAFVFHTDDDGGSAIVYRFAHVEQIEAFRKSPDLSVVHAVRTFDLRTG